MGGEGGKPNNQKLWKSLLKIVLRLKRLNVYQKEKKSEKRVL